MYLSLHIPCPFGTIPRAASDVFKDSIDVLISEQNLRVIIDGSSEPCSCVFLLFNFVQNIQTTVVLFSFQVLIKKMLFLSTIHTVRTKLYVLLKKKQWMMSNVNMVRMKLRWRRWDNENYRIIRTRKKIHYPLDII